MMHIPTHSSPSRGRSGGSVLVFTLIITTVVAMLTLSSLSSMNQTLAVARAEEGTMQAEFAALSALEHARRLPQAMFTCFETAPSFGAADISVETAFGPSA